MTDTLEESTNFLRAWRLYRKLTLEEVAHGAGTDKTQVQKLEKGTRRLTTEWLERVGKPLRASPQELMGPPPGSNASLTKTSQSEEKLVNELVRAEGVDSLPFLASWPQDVPILGTAVGGNGDGDFYLNGESGGHAYRPKVLAGVEKVFALYISNDSMTPVFRPGKLVYVSAARAPAIGDYVIVEMHAENGERNGPALLKELVRRTAKEIFLRQLNPLLDLKPIPVDRVKHLYRAYHPDELQGN